MLSKNVKAFCKHCDYIQKCPVGPFNQRRYVARNWCDRSSIQQVNVQNVTIDSIEIRDKIYQRDNLPKLMKILKKE